MEEVPEGVAAGSTRSSRAVTSHGANIFRNERLRVDLSNKKNRKGVRALVMEISLVTCSIGGNFSKSTIFPL